MRRVVPLAVATVLGGLGLTACRSEPAVAVYLGKTTISQDWVEQLAQEIWDESKAQPGGPQVANDLAGLRQAIVREKILDLVVRDTAARTGVAVPELNADEAASVIGSLGSSPKLANSEFAKLLVSAQAAMCAVEENLEPVEPTEADQREVYDSVVNQKIQAVPFEEAKASLDKGFFGKQLALRAMLREQVERLDITVNPRYAPMALDIMVPVNQRVNASLAVKLAAHR